jgi:hypothetical protein
MNTLREAAEEYLSLRRHLGYKLDRSGRLLLQFVSFMEQRKAQFITSDLGLEWAVLPTKVQPVYWASRLSAVRLFAQHRRATDPRTEVPALGLLRARYQRKRPYLYSEDEIARLMGAAARLASLTGLRAQTYVTLLGLLTVAGLRISEAEGAWQLSSYAKCQTRGDPRLLPIRRPSGARSQRRHPAGPGDAGQEVRSLARSFSVPARNRRTPRSSRQSHMARQA